MNTSHKVVFFIVLAFIHTYYLFTHIEIFCFGFFYPNMFHFRLGFSPLTSIVFPISASAV